MRITRTVETDTPLTEVFSYLSDFRSSNDWDPGTVETTRTSGDGGKGTIYHNVSSFMGRTTELDYTVTVLEDGKKFQLRGTNPTVEAVDTMVFSRTANDGTTVQYDAHFSFKGATRYLAPLMTPVLWLAFKKLGDEAQEGLQRELDRLGAR